MKLIKKISQHVPIVASIIDNLTSTSSVDGLSANQGRILKELLDNIDNAKEDKIIDTGWLTLNEIIKYRKVGKIVFININCDNRQIEVGNGNYEVIGTLPVGYRPSIAVNFVIQCVGGGMNNQSCYVQPSGNISIFFPTGTTVGYFAGSLSFPIS